MGIFRFSIIAILVILQVELPLTAYGYTYLVKKGDTLSQHVARLLVPGPVWGKNGSLKKILALNPGIKNPNLIYPGQEIFLPEEKIAQTNSSVVVSSERAPSTEENSDDGSSTSIEVTPFFSMATINSTDLNSGTKDSVASSVDFGLDARFVQIWNDSFKTYLRGELNYVSFAQPVNSLETLSSSSKFLTTFGVGVTQALSSRLHLGGSFDLGQNLFLRAASSTSVTVDSVLIPSVGAKISYDLVQLNAFILAASLEYQEELKASTDAYSVGVGSLYGGTIEVRERKPGEDGFAVDIGGFQRNQNTSLTNQTETTYTLALKLFFPRSDSNKNKDQAQ